MRVIVVEGGTGPMVYCEGCGAIAGVSTKCMCWNSHSFVSTTVPVICEGCGAIPGDPSECECWNKHSFIPVPKPSKR